MITSIRIATDPSTFADELAPLADLVDGPSSTCSWIVAWCRATSAQTALVLGSDSGGNVVFALPLERTTVKKVHALRTIAFRQGPFGAVLSKQPVAELFDDRVRSLLRSALWQAGFRVPLVFLFDIRGAAECGASSAIALQSKHVASASVPASDAAGATFVGKKESTELRRRHRRLADRVGDAVETHFPAAVDDVQAALTRLLASKRQLSEGRPTASEIDHPDLDRFFQNLAVECSERGDLEVLIATLGSESVVVAENLVVCARGEAHGLVQTFDADFSKFSPGRLVLRDLVDELARRNVTTVNFGKTESKLPRFATESEQIYDYVLPIHKLLDRPTAAFARKAMARDAIEPQAEAFSA